MRKGWRLWVATALAALWLTCAAASAQTTLTFYAVLWPERQQAIEEFVIPAFEAKHPGVKVELIASEAGKLQAMIAGGTPPDVAYAASPEFPALVKAGVFEPLDGYLEKYNFDRSNVLDRILERYTWEGKLYGLPFDGVVFNSFAWYVNLDMFNEAGIQPPWADYNDPFSGWSYDDMLEMARKLTVDRNNDGQMEQWGVSPSAWASPTWYRVMWSFGGDILDASPDWHSTVNSPEVIEAISYLHQLKFQYGVVGGVFENGTVALREAALDLASRLYSEETFDWTITAAPRGPNGRWNIIGGNPMGVTAGSKNKDLAFQFMQHFLSDEVQIYLSDRDALPPQTYSSARREEFVYSDIPPYDKSGFLFGTQAKSMPLWAPGWTEINQAFSQAIGNGLWNNADLSPANELQKLHQRIEAILAENR